MSQNNYSAEHAEYSGLSSLKECQELLTNAPIGIFTSTPEGRLISANPALAHMLGYETPWELLESITDIDAQVFADPREDEMFRYILKRRGKVEGYECRFQPRGGQKTIWVSVNACLAGDKYGHASHYLVYVSDVSEKKRLESLVNSKDRALEERRKELYSLYKIHYTHQKSLPLKDFLQEVVETIPLIPFSFQYPDITYTRIVCS